MNLIWVFIAAGLVTYLTRLSFIYLLEKVSIPHWVERALRFVPIAVLSAIIFPEIFLHDGILFISPANNRLIAGTIAALVAWRTKNVVLTILVGMGVLWLLQAFAW